jgi:hypothetical protein
MFFYRCPPRGGSQSCSPAGGASVTAWDVSVRSSIRYAVEADALDVYAPDDAHLAFVRITTDGSGDRSGRRSVSRSPDGPSPPATTSTAFRATVNYRGALSAADNLDLSIPAGESRATEYDIAAPSGGELAWSGRNEQRTVEFG